MWFRRARFQTPKVPQPTGQAAARLVERLRAASASCRAGRIEACAQALGLADAGPMWRNWYDEAQLDAWMRERGPGYGHQVDRRGCYVERDAESCARLAAQGRGPPAPLDRRPRESLLAYALERGGVQGYERLRADPSGTVLERLARTAQSSRTSWLPAGV